MPGSMMEHTLESLLNDKDLRLDFIFYVNKIHAQESLLFWMEVEMFKRIADSDEYIHPSARAQINVSAKLREQLETTMATGIWDQTLYDAIQVSVHEVLKFSVVRDFCQYVSKRKTMMDPDPDSAACVMLGRYEGSLHRREKDKEFGSLRIKGPIGWLKKKSGDKPAKDKKGGSSFLGKYRYTKVKPSESSGALMPIPEEPDTPYDRAPSPCEELAQKDEQSMTPAHRARLTQQRLQEQIQLLRTLHQHQHENFKGPDSHFNTLEFANATTNATPLAKSISMPAIIRGMSMANFGKHKS